MGVTTVYGSVDSSWGAGMRPWDVGMRLVPMHAVYPHAGLGIAAVSGSSDPRLAAVATKKIALLEGPNTPLSAKLSADSRTDGTDVSPRGG